MLDKLRAKEAGEEIGSAEAEGNDADESSGGVQDREELEDDAELVDNDKVQDYDGVGDDDGVQPSEGIGGDPDDEDEDEDASLENFCACPAAVKPFTKSTLKNLREWRSAKRRLTLTRDQHVAQVTEIQNPSKDNKGNIVQPLVQGCTMPTARRWMRMLSCLDVCHELCCCSASSNILEALDRREWAGKLAPRDKPKCAEGNAGQTQSNRPRGALC